MGGPLSSMSLRDWLLTPQSSSLLQLLPAFGDNVFNGEHFNGVWILLG
jgi:hypothetical protein